MTYYDRLDTASWESPNGNTFEFKFTEIRRDIPHRVGSFTFRKVDGTHHQISGTDGDIYPFTMYFSGPDYDQVADSFVTASKEQGFGILNHPRFGRKKVAILSFSQLENFTESAGQVVFNVRFQETLDEDFPQPSVSLPREIITDVNNFETTVSENYGDQVENSTLVGAQSLLTSMTEATAAVNATIGPLTDSVNEIASEFGGIISGIERNINDLVDQPVMFAQSIYRAIKTVTGIPGRIDSKKRAYSDLLATIGITPTGGGSVTKNKTLTNELVGTSALVIASQDIGTTDFSTRADSLDSAVFIRDNFVSLVETLDDSSDREELLELSYLQSAESYSETAGVVSKAIENSIVGAFNLPAERTIVTTKPETITNLCYELYGNIDDNTLDDFINSNGFNGSEIILIPQGRAVVYYA